MTKSKLALICLTPIVIIRLIAMVFMLILSFFISIFIFPFIPTATHTHIIKYWAFVLIWFAGAKLEISDEAYLSFKNRNTMIIANHVSWLDVPVLCALHAVNFVAKIEIKKWPFIGIIASRSGTIFINRTQKRVLSQINDSIGEHLSDGKMVAIFPEGTTSDGTSVTPFKSSLFEASITANATIIPIVLKYYNKKHQFAIEASYAGTTNLFNSIVNTLFLNGVIIKVIKLKPVCANSFASRNELSRHLFEQIHHAYNKDTHHAK